MIIRFAYLLLLYAVSVSLVAAAITHAWYERQREGRDARRREKLLNRINHW